jgi:hypothetical protein
VGSGSCGSRGSALFRTDPECPVGSVRKRQVANTEPVSFVAGADDPVLQFGDGEVQASAAAVFGGGECFGPDPVVGVPPNALE